MSLGVLSLCLELFKGDLRWPPYEVGVIELLLSLFFFLGETLELFMFDN